MREQFQLRPAGDALRQAEIRGARLADGTIRRSKRSTRRKRSRSPKILPVYPLTEGLQQWQMRKIVRGAVETYAEVLDEVFPDEYLRRHDLWPLGRALPQVHFPSDQESLDRARRRLVYQELFILQLGVGRQAAAAARSATGAAAGGHGQDRRPHPPAVPLRADRRPAAGHRRDCRRHGRPAADEPAACRATWGAARPWWPSMPCCWPWPTATRPC